MARSFTITQSQVQRPRSNALLHDTNDSNEHTMKYDPCRKATEREDLHSPLERLDINQKFTCTYVPTTESDANDANPMSPISVTLEPQAHHSSPSIIEAQLGTWDGLVRNGVALGEGAPAALDPDDSLLHHASIQQQEEGEEEREKTWSGLVQDGAVLGDGGVTASEVDTKVKLWGLTCAV